MPDTEVVQGCADLVQFTHTEVDDTLQLTLASQKVHSIPIPPMQKPLSYVVPNYEVQY